MRAFIEFAAPEHASRALKTLTSLGYLDTETYGPFPLTEDDAHAPRGSIVLSGLAFGGGAFALAAAYLVQWYANVRSYPLNIGGRPVHAGPAFVPATFESICLFATAALFLGFLLVEHLPRLWQPVFEIDGFEHATIDRFWIAVEIDSTREAVGRLTTDVVAMHPLRIVVPEGAG